MKTLTVQPAETELSDDVKAILSKGKAGKRRWIRDHVFLAAWMVGLGSWRILYPIFFHRHPPMYLFPAILCASVVPLMVYLSLMNKRELYGLSKPDVKYLVSLKDKRIIGSILDFFRVDAVLSSYLQERTLLLGLLPLITSDDSRLLTRQQKTRLAFLLQISEDELNLVVLRVFEQIGDKAQLPLLKLWKANQLGSRIKPEIKEAYKSCIAAIKAREGTSRSDSQLLRPSFPDERADTYLRPVEQKLDEDADTLLRAEIGDKE